MGLTLCLAEYSTQVEDAGPLVWELSGVEFRVWDSGLTFLTLF